MTGWEMYLRVRNKKALRNKKRSVVYEAKYIVPTDLLNATAHNMLAEAKANMPTQPPQEEGLDV